MDRSPYRTLRAVFALALAFALVPTPGVAAPFLAFPQPAAVQSVGVDVAQASPSVAPDGALRANVMVSLAAPADYVEVRLRLRGKSGTLLYQKTEVRSDLPAGTHAISYDYDLAGLDLSQGRYPIEIRVLATGSEPTNVTSRLLVVEPGTVPAQVALLVAVTGEPGVASDGRFVHDPATDTSVRDDVAFLTQVALSRRQPLALAVPPVLLEQLARAASGYETTAGLAVPADAEVPTRYARAIDELRSAVASGAIDLVDVPYALPDLAGLDMMGRPDDLVTHWERTDAVLAATLQSATTSETAYLGDAVTSEALATLAERGTPAVVVPDHAVRSADETAAPGCYPIDGSSVLALVADTDAAGGIAEGADAFYDAAFDRLGTSPCIVAVLSVGPGTVHDAVDVQRALDWISAVPWLRPVSLADVTATADATGSEAAAVVPAGPVSSAPAEGWTSIGPARIAAEAYVAATTVDDAEARAVRDATLVAESTLWAGADGAWSAWPGAVARAAEAAAFVTEQFSRIIVDAKDVTLSGRRGDVPFTLVNGTGKPLNLTVTASADELRISEPEIALTAQPDENFVTVPVDLRAIISDEMRVVVRSQSFTVAEATVTVRTSYLDRLVTLGLVVIVLVGLLLFIRRRVTSAITGTAGTIAGSDERED
jgi:hypothetical protein